MEKIVVDSVTKTFVKGKNVLKALDEVSFKVKEGSFVSIIGPSGCGKTTLLRIIHGLIKPDKGNVIIDGKPVTNPELNRAFVFQHIGLYPWRTLIDNVALGLEIRGIPKNERYEIAKKYINMVGLKGFEYHYPHELSGGMQQRAGLARALAINPDILLMDEPFGALDAQTRRLLQEQLMVIWEQFKKTAIFVTHDLDEAIFLSDEIIVMTKRPGRVKDIIKVDIPRPRGPNSFKHPHFLDLKDKLWNMLREELDLHLV